MRNNYNTKSKNLIDEEIINFPNGFTIKELFNRLKEKGNNIGLTTIYRRIIKLEEDGIIKKYFDENNVSKYKYVNDCLSQRHFYLKCIKCEKMIHIDCECIDEFYNHVLKSHKFYLNIKNNIFLGLCNSCKNFIVL